MVTKTQENQPPAGHGKAYVALVTFFLKWGLLLSMAIVATLAFFLASKAPPSAQVEDPPMRTWINGVDMGVSQARAQAPNLLLPGLIGLGIGLLAVTLVMMARFKNFDLNQGTPMSAASPRRKGVFAASLLLGYTGLDRLLMGRPFLGAGKLLFTALAAGMLVPTVRGLVLEDAMTPPSVIIGISLGLAVVLLYWWIADVLLVHSGMAREKGGCLLD